jgi:hypothetical protein
MANATSLPKRLTNRQKDVVRALACLMWADGNAAPQERQIIEEVIAALGPTEEERREMQAWLERDVVKLADVELERLDDAEKELLLSDAILLTYADDVALPSEKAILDKLRERLGVTEDTLQRIADDVREENAISLPGSVLEEPSPPPLPGSTPRIVAAAEAPEIREVPVPIETPPEERASQIPTLEPPPSAA